jgi:hypothetical protein
VSFQIVVYSAYILPCLGDMSVSVRAECYTSRYCATELSQFHSGSEHLEWRFSNILAYDGTVFHRQHNKIAYVATLRTDMEQVKPYMGMTGSDTTLI